MVFLVRSSSASPALEDKEYIGGVPVVSFRDGSGSPSSVPQLPHIPGAIPLTPIGEISREQTTVVPLPPIGKGNLSVFFFAVFFLFDLSSWHACSLWSIQNFTIYICTLYIYKLAPFSTSNFSHIHFITCTIHISYIYCLSYACMPRTVTLVKENNMVEVSLILLNCLHWFSWYFHFNSPTTN